MITEFELHAYIDGELTGEERTAVLEAVEHSPELDAELNALRHVKDLLRTAYRDAYRQSDHATGQARNDALAQGPNIQSSILPKRPLFSP